MVHQFSPERKKTPSPKGAASAACAKEFAAVIMHRNIMLPGIHEVVDR
jgi:hypothetical protein